MNMGASSYENSSDFDELTQAHGITLKPQNAYAASPSTPYSYASANLSRQCGKRPTHRGLAEWLPALWCRCLRPPAPLACGSHTGQHLVLAQWALVFVLPIPN